MQLAVWSARRVVPFLVAAALPLSSFAQSANSLESYQSARAVVQRAVDAMGGLPALQTKKSVLLKFEGKDYKVGQSLRPGDDNYDVLATDGSVFLEPEKKRARIESATRYLPDYLFTFANVIDGDKGIALNTRWESWSEMQGAGATFRSLLRARPHLLVQAALARPLTLRDLGVRTDGDRRLHLVTFADSDGSQNTMYFDESNGLLAKTESMFGDPVRGDVIAESWYLDYHDVDGVQMPGRLLREENGHVVRDLRFTEIAFNKPFDVAWMTPPANYAKSADPGAMTLNRVGAGAYTLTFPDPTALVVEVDGGVLVVDGAPGDPATAEAGLKKIREAFPGKSVRLAITHFHHDHTGGIRGYVANGIPILTTEANREWLSGVSKAAETISPDSLVGAPKEPIVETFRGKKVLRGADQVVELYALQGTPHSNEMVIAYLPKEKLLFQSDLLIVPREKDINMSPAMSRFLLAEIKRLKLDVKTIVGFHGRVVTMEELKKFVG